MRQYFRIHLQERPPVVRREAETEQWVRTRPTPLAVRKGAAIPEHPFEIQPALADMAVPCLRHTPHTVHTLDRAARAHRVGQDVPNPCVRFRPIRGQTLAQELFHDDQLRRVMVRRLKSELPGFPERKINPLEPAEGWTAVNPTLARTTQYGLYYKYPNLKPWFEYLRPKERVGSIRLYYVAPGLLRPAQ